jgi:small multidrug resistance pump
MLAMIMAERYGSVMNPYLALGIAIVAEVIATALLKASNGFANAIPAVTSMAIYGVSFYFLSQALRVVPVGVTYAVWSGAGIVLISLAGWLVFGQKLDTAAIFGMALIIAGVMVVNLVSGSTGH